MIQEAPPLGAAFSFMAHERQARPMKASPRLVDGLL
jgi:hypothetical protein